MRAVITGRLHQWEIGVTFRFSHYSCSFLNECMSQRIKDRVRKRLPPFYGCREKLENLKSVHPKENQKASKKTPI